MITKEQIEAGALEDYQEHQDLSRFDPFKAGAKWALEQQEWIKTSDKMPPEFVSILCLIPDQGDYIAVAVWEQKVGWYEDYNGFIIDDPVTHWMPLPEPPKTEIK